MREQSLADASALALLATYVAEIGALYPGWTPTTGPKAEPEDLAPPRGRFIVAYDGSEPVACGGFRRIDDNAAEIKRLYVRPEARGNGLGRRLLERLEQEARGAGYSVVRLDTGPTQPAALRLFQTTGYVEIPDYNGNPFAAHWFEKRLDDVRPGDRWREGLRHFAVPESIVDSAPEPDVTLEPERFRWRPEEDAKQPVRPSRARAREALPEGGTVLDVGVGGGASSLGLAPKVGLIVGVDPLPGMLESFQASAEEAGVAARAVLGTWPDVANDVEPADVAVCHHAMYRVEQIEDFVTALTAKARHRVVVELSARSPLSGFDPLWRSLHGIERPDWPVADEAQRVLIEMGLAVEREDIVLPPRAPEVTPATVAFVRRRLYVGPERDAEIEEFLRGREPQEQRVVALWWPGEA